MQLVDLGDMLVVTTLQQVPAHEGAQDATTQIGLYLGHSCLVDSTGRVEDDARWCGLGIGVAHAWHFLKHAIDHTDVEVLMPVQAGAEPVDEGYGPDVQGGSVHMGRPGAVGLQSLRNHPQEDAQHHVEHCPITLHEVAQPLRDPQHPVAHWQAGEDVIREVRRRIHHAPCVARRANAPAFAGRGHEVVVTTIVTAGAGKAVGEVPHSRYLRKAWRT